MNAVKVLCDKAILLDHGTAIAYGEPESIINAYNCHISRRSKGDEDLRAGRSRNGYGSRQVLIASVTLKDEHQNETQILVSGKPADIVISLKGQTSMEDLTLGIVIRDRFGQDVYGTNSHYLKKKIDVQQEQTMDIVYSFDQFNLGPGKYSITAAIHTGASHVDQCVHWVDGCAVFETVLGDEPFFAGLIRLTPDLHITRD
jgi:lipopolysaccharide transport system ATP-binding protein